MATIKDIAKKAGVSASVVSRALNNKYGVNEKTRAKIIQIARELQYYPNALARSLVTRKTETIGVVIADISEPFYSRIIKGMYTVADRAGYTLLFSNSYESLEKTNILHKMVDSERVDGLVIVGSNIRETEFVLNLLQEKIPFVLIERKLDDPKVNCIWVENEEGARLATDYLIQKGHTRIAHITGTHGIQVTIDRLAGYKQALASARLPFNPAYIRTGDFLHEGGYRATRELLQLNPRPTAIFAGNDTMAYGALQAISEFGLSVPDEIAVIGFDDLEFSVLTNPPLTTIRQPRFEMGKKAIEILLRVLAGEEEASGVKAAFPTELVVRRSV
ncbi:MAG TPA: LacI family DNA-binding transcriptional regulator [Capillibacterium sp.]